MGQGSPEERPAPTVAGTGDEESGDPGARPQLTGRAEWGAPRERGQMATREEEVLRIHAIWQLVLIFLKLLL